MEDSNLRLYLTKYEIRNLAKLGFDEKLIPSNLDEFVKDMEKLNLNSSIVSKFIRLACQYNIFATIYSKEKCKTPIDVFMKWNQFHTQFLDEYQNSGIFENEKLINTSKIEKYTPLFKELHAFYHICSLSNNSRWTVEILDGLWNSMNSNKIPILQFIGFYYQFLETGHFEIIDTKEVRYGNMYMTIKFLPDLHILAGVFLEAVPVHFKTFSYFKYRQVLKIFYFTKNTSSYEHDRTLYSYRMKIKNHENKGKPFHPQNVFESFITEDLPYGEQYIHMATKDLDSKKLNESDLKRLEAGFPVYCPITVRLKPRDSLDSKISLSKKAETVVNNSENQEAVMKFIERIINTPQNDKIKKFSELKRQGLEFSKTQRKILTSDTSMLVVGRSGTGKTTIVSFKMLSVDLLFMAYKHKFVHGKDSSFINESDFDWMTGCRTVFCTASPVLTSEVKRFYSELISSVKDSFRERKEKMLKGDEETKDLSNKDEDEEIINTFKSKYRDMTEEEINQEASISELEKMKNDIIEELEIEKKLTVYNSLSSVPKNEYPLFLTVKKLIYMLDGNCSYSFFSRDQSGKIFGMESCNEWHNEGKQGALMINQYQKEIIDYNSKLKHVCKQMMDTRDINNEEKLKFLQSQGFEMNEEEYKNMEEDEKLKEIEKAEEMELQAQRKYLNLKEKVEAIQGISTSSSMQLNRQIFSKEVDFEMFEKHFWGKSKGSLKISAINAWTEIFTIIKGNFISYYTVNYLVPWVIYKNMKSSMDYLEENERHHLYLVYVKYENWKNKHNYYDFMDVVKHVSVYYPSWKRDDIDYLIIDEVQDLAPLTIQTLLRACKRYEFFSGDTAQTIAKGVSFKFTDLIEIYNKRKTEFPKIVQLTKNYRSHGKILELANSIVDLIQLYFPHTIDKLKREISDLEGPKPIILEGYTPEDLISVMTNHSESNKSTFGSNQVVIVRTQEAKNNLPFFLKHSLCLTVFETKGLEFEDVILYDFFCDSKCDKHWRIINDVCVTYRQIESKNKLIDSDDEDEREVPIVTTTREREDIDRNFNLLCSELKHLYVAVTRAKTRLFIYDSDEKNKEAMYDYWKSMDLVDICVKGREYEHPTLRNAFNTIQSEEESKEMWRAMGIKLFRQKFYSSVVQCFEKSGDEDLKTRTLGYMYADEASNLMSDSETLLYEAKINKSLSKYEKSKKKREGKQLMSEAYSKFQSAGEYFEKIDVTKNAAQCYYSAKNYIKAADLFEKAKFLQQAAECHRMCNNFSKAAKIFEECGLYLKCFECYENERDWEGLLLCLHRNKDNFKDFERESLVSRYVPIALNSIYMSMGDKQFEEQNRGKIFEQKYMKKIEIIREDDDDSLDSDDSEDENNKSADNNQQPDEKLNEDEEQKEISQQNINLSNFEGDNSHNKDEEEIITSKQTAKEDSKKEKDLDDSNMSSFCVISKGELNQNFEHLSNFDPEDEFLQSDQSFSVIGSMISKDNDKLSEYSDFSVVSSSRISQIKKENVISSDRDVYLEDVAMQKIIYYISLFSDEVKHQLEKLRSKDGLVQLKHENLSADSLELELDNIDAELVKLILDVLEHFDMFRLCLIVCSRYNMKEYISRYLTSICYKYSNLQLLDLNKILKINDISFRFGQQQVNILANEAVHNMLALIDPIMIGQQRTEDIDFSSKLINVECWRYIYYLGFWKKLIYIMDSHSSLELCSTIGDFENFKMVYLLNYRPELSNDEISSLAKTPSSNWIGDTSSLKIRFLCNKVALEESISTLDTENINQNCKCNININKFLKSCQIDKTYKLEYLCEALMHADNVFSTFCNSKDVLAIIKQNLGDNKSEEYYSKEIEFFDIFLMYGRIFENKVLRDYIKESLNCEQDFACNIRYSISKIINFLIKLVDKPENNLPAFNISLNNIAIQGILSPSKIRLPEDSKLFIKTLSNCLLHRSSSFYKFLESIVNDFKGDRFNREFISTVKYSNKLKENNFMFGSMYVISEMNKFITNQAGRDHTYQNLTIADLEAEYVNVPINLVFYWIKKVFYSFISQTICFESVKEIPVYKAEDLESNKHYNEVLLAQYLRHDYWTSLNLFSINMNIIYKINYGSLDRTILRSQKEESSNSQLKWYVDLYNTMLQKCNEAKSYSGNFGSNFRYYRNEHLIGMKFSKTLNKKLNLRNEKVIETTQLNLDLLDGIQKPMFNNFNQADYDIQMQRGYQKLNEFINFHLIAENDNESFEYSRLQKLIKCVYIFSRTNRLDVITKFGRISSLSKSFQKDKEGLMLFKKVENLIKAIECYNLGKWGQAISLYIQFLTQSFKIMKIDDWLRIFETAWYLAITATWGQKYHIYLPVSTLNYVFEEANVNSEEDLNQDYHYIKSYERTIDIDYPQEKDNKAIFVKMINHFKEAFEYYNDNQSQGTQKMLIAIFNMVGTLITDCDTATNNICNSIQYIIKVFSQSELLENENIEKFIDYFNDRNACSQFKNDFFEIDDTQKNDTLYFDSSDNANNQYFVQLFIKQKSKDQKKAVLESVNNYKSTKAMRMVAHCTLLRLLSQKVKNYKLKKNTENTSIPANLSMNGFNWICLKSEENMNQVIKIASKDPKMLMYVDKIYEIQLQLMNIMNNHFSIRNSLDTHFVVARINETSEYLNYIRNYLSLSINEALYNKNPNETDESFNPFVEIGEDYEEKKLVSVDNTEEKIQEIVDDVIIQLEIKYNQLQECIEDWIEAMPEPEILNIGAKQSAYSKKLRWEKVLELTHKDKTRNNVEKLQNIFRMLRISRRSRR